MYIAIRISHTDLKGVRAAKHLVQASCTELTLPIFINKIALTKRRSTAQK